MKKLSNWTICVVAAVLVACWYCIFSDYQLHNAWTINDTINTAFFAVFFVASVFCSLELANIDTVRIGLIHAKQYLKEHSLIEASDYEDLTSCFADDFTSSLFKNYYQKKQLLFKIFPNGGYGSIDDYFFDENFDEYLKVDVYNQFPGFFAGLGMLGTFAGLSLGLLSLPNFAGESAEKMLEQLNPLMSCIQVAFITSISGLILSFLFNFQYRGKLKCLYESLDQFVGEYTANVGAIDSDGIGRMLEQQSEQSKILKALGNEIASSVASVLDKQISNMEKTYNEACNRLSNAQMDGMSHLVSEFTKELMGTLTAGVGKLTEAVNNTCAIQKTISSRIEEDITNILKMSGTVQEIQKLSELTMTNMKAYTDHMDNTVKSMLDQVKSNNEIMGNTAVMLRDFEAQAVSMTNASSQIRVSLGAWQEADGDHINKMDDVAGKLSGVIEDIENYSSNLKNVISLSFAEYDEKKKLFTSQSDEIIKSIRETSENATTSVNNAVSSIRDTVERCQKEISDVSNDATKKMCQDMTALGEKCAFTAVSFDDAISNIRLAVNSIPEKLGDYKGEINSFKGEISDKLDSASKEQTEKICDTINVLKQLIVQQDRNQPSNSALQSEDNAE